MRVEPGLQLTLRKSAGDDGQMLREYAVFEASGIASRGGKRCNGWGLFDMHGIAQEWCWDWNGNYGNGVVSDPTGPLKGIGRVQRGGNWHGYAMYCRLSHRDSGHPCFGNINLGFRVAKAPPGQ